MQLMKLSVCFECVCRELCVRVAKTLCSLDGALVLCPAAGGHVRLQVPGGGREDPVPVRRREVPQVAELIPKQNRLLLFCSDAEGRGRGIPSRNLVATLKDRSWKNRIRR